MDAGTILEILALLAEYGQTVDQQRWDEHRALWATDSHLVVFGNDHAGCDTITTFMKGSPRGKHLTGIPNIQIHDDRASVRSDFVFFNDQLALRTAGSYVDDLVRENGRWCFMRRQIEIQLRAAS